ncbi:MAG: hypothetical protein Q8L41_05080 [Anaerolineales bacterium]|nr:hypothetical protein [Anaerolineales bacterium]MDP2776041.1 hypothetical protein [Anaerolineales bacterium]
MLKKLIPVLLAIAVLLTACAPQGAPTLAPAEVEGTAVAAAWTIVAMTQLALPTATPVPPTETPSPTPLPTFTPFPLPTLELSLPTATQATGDCLKPLNVAEAGPQSSVRLENVSGGNKVTLSLNLRTNLFGQCGYVGYTLGKNEKLVVSLPKGEYYAYAWITYSDGDTSNASGYVNNRVGDNHLFVVKIKKEVISVP